MVLAANHNPYGNKGADLIETIRCERMSGAHVHTRPHPAVDQNTKRAVRTTAPGAHAKPWNEGRWDRARPASASTAHRVKAHDPKLLADMLAS